MAGATYWVGQNGNVYFGDGKGGGVKDYGKALNAYDGGFDTGTFSAEARRIADPNVQQAAAPAQSAASYATGSGGGGSSVAAKPAPDKEAVAYWNDQQNSLQRLLDSSNVQRDQGLAGLNNSYNRNLSDVNDSESKTMRDYMIKAEDTQKERQGALRTIDTSARQGNEGLKRLFQLSGAAGSSAATMVAPNAVARDASTKRTGTLETFGKNIRNIDLAKEDATTQFAKSRRDLESQKREKEQSFIEGILNLQNDLNSKLSNAVTQRGIAQGGTYSGLAGARAQYDNSIRSNQSALDNLFNTYRDPQYNVNPVQAKAPDLSQYTVDPTALDMAQQNPGVPEELLPYLPQLKKDGGLASLLG
jgi:hypothetical protein